MKKKLRITSFVNNFFLYQPSPEDPGTCVVTVLEGVPLDGRRDGVLACRGPGLGELPHEGDKGLPHEGDKGPNLQLFFIQRDTRASLHAIFANVSNSDKRKDELLTY